MHVLIVGSGGIGTALTAHSMADPGFSRVTVWRRSAVDGRADPSGKCITHQIDLLNETTITTAALSLAEVDLAIVATGLLHDAAAHVLPEKTWRSLDAGTMRRNFEINTIGPALVAKRLLPLLPRDRRAVFAVLSARVGSISDNRLGDGIVIERQRPH